MLIAVEGLDGSGKSTQIYLLKRWLELQGLRFFSANGIPPTLVKNATSKGKKRELLSPTTFSLIHATDFADRYERQLVPLLARRLHRLVRPLYFHRVCPRHRARLPAGMGARHL